MDAVTPRSPRRPSPGRSPGKVTGWLLAEAEREALLDRFPPAYPEVVAHHVTLKMGARPREPLPPPCSGTVVGEADDGAGVQCLVVAIDGSTERPDGGTYHVTWSLARGRRPVESNGVIAWLGWREVEPTPLTLTPARF